MNFDIVIPALKEDLCVLEEHFSFIQSFINFKNVIIISKKDTPINVPNAYVIDENSLYHGLDYNAVMKKIFTLGGDVKRTGWYFQQFLKMVYSYTCKNDYYLLWDTDTFPINKIEMFKNNKPVFHMKTEFHKPYFDTLNKLSKGEIIKMEKRSFISEHMLINRNIMIELINYIESNYPGKPFWETILEAIDNENLSKSGFSEFETYGNYVLKYHNDCYYLENYCSLRLGCRMFGKNPTEDDIKWASKGFSAISLEKYDNISSKAKLWKSKLVRFIFPCKLVYNLYLKFSKK